MVTPYWEIGKYGGGVQFYNNTSRTGQTGIYISTDNGAGSPGGIISFKSKVRADY